MARASTPTLLSLDRYARILGINPCHFNGGREIYLANNVKLFPLYNAQNNYWPQYAWQNNGMVSREDLARLIWEAEQEIITKLRFIPGPMWIEADMYSFSEYYRPDIGYAVSESRTGERGVTLRYHGFIEAGRRAVTLLGSPAIVYSDVDGDGFNEVATITVNNVTCDISEIHAFHPNHDGDAEWEVTMPRSMSIAAGVLTMTFNTWQCINEGAVEVWATDEDSNNGISVDITDVGNLLAAMDVYRIYTDTTQNSAVFYGTDMADHVEVSETGYFHMQNRASNFVVPHKATYADGVWTITSHDGSYNIDRVALYYKAGYTNPTGRSSIPNDPLDEHIARAIAYMATARLERVFYANNNATALAVSLREDLSRLPQGTGFRYMTKDVLSCPFGTMRGEVEAWMLLRAIPNKGMIKGAVL